jgi:hypothetical protein
LFSTYLLDWGTIDTESWLLRKLCCSWGWPAEQSKNGAKREIMEKEMERQTLRNIKLNMEFSCSLGRVEPAC